MLARVILAAGESRRMGTPKALLPLRGRTFLEHLLAVTRHPRLGVTRVVLGAHASAIRDAVPLDDTSVVFNENWQQGQLSTIHAALRSLPAGQTEGMLLCPVDTPLISTALITELIARFDSSPKSIVLPAYLEKRGHPVIFPGSLFDELLHAPADVGARAVVWAHAADVLEVPTVEEGCVLNLNEPENLRRVQL